MDSLPYAQLKKLCKERGLSPCTGKGITRAVLLEKLKSQVQVPSGTVATKGLTKNKQLSPKQSPKKNVTDSRSDLKKQFPSPRRTKHEELVKLRDPEQYETMKPYVANVPDLRDFESEEAKQSLEAWNPWRALWEDLETLDESEARESTMEGELLEMMTTDKDYVCDYARNYIDEHKRDIEYFFETYRVLSYIMVRVYDMAKAFALKLLKSPPIARMNVFEGMAP